MICIDAPASVVASDALLKFAPVTSVVPKMVAQLPGVIGLRNDAPCTTLLMTGMLLGRAVTAVTNRRSSL